MEDVEKFTINYSATDRRTKLEQMKKVLNRIQSLLQKYAFAQIREDVVSVLISEIKDELSLGDGSTGGLDTRGLTQSQRISNLFSLISSQQVLAPDSIERANLVFINLSGSLDLDGLSKSIRNMISTQPDLRNVVKIEMKSSPVAVATPTAPAPPEVAIAKTSVASVRNEEDPGPGSSQVDSNQAKPTISVSPQVRQRPQSTPPDKKDDDGDDDDGYNLC